MVTRRKVVCWCRLLLVTCQYLPCVCATSYTGTTAVQWTLYSGLKLSWNEASMFCKSLGGHLPVVNTKLKWNGFNSTVVNWHKANVLVDDVWTGLFSQTPSDKPDSWEADCSLQPDGLDFWGPSEPDNLNTDLCIRFQLVIARLRTINCSFPLGVICEYDEGSCRSITGSSLLLGASLATTRLDATTAAACWEQCLNYTTTWGGQDCVAATLLLEVCTAYLGDTLLSTSTSTSQTLLTKTMFKECFRENITNIYNNYIFVDRNNIPRPAGDPCGTNMSSFVPVVPVSGNTTGVQTTLVASAQTTWSGQTTTPTTKQQSSVIPKTNSTSQSIIDIINLGVWATLPLNNSTLTNSTVGVNNSTRLITSSTLPYDNSTTSANFYLSTNESSLLINSSSLPFSNATSPFNDTTLQTNGSISQTNSSTSQSKGSTLQTNGSTSQTNGSTPQINGSTIQTNSSTLQTNGSTTQTNSSAVQTNSSILHNNSSTKSVTSSTLPVASSGLTSGTPRTTQSNEEQTTNIDNNTLGPVNVSMSNDSTKGFQPLLCPCMKSLPSSLASMETPIIHRSNTSKYRRSLNSELGSPSAFTSTSSATFVIVVGVAGFLFVVCDINRLMVLCNKKPPKKSRDTERVTELVME